MMSTKTRAYNIGVLLLVTMLTKIDGLRWSSLDATYKKGFDAYTGERWSECIAQFEGSLHLYKLYKTILRNCRQICNSQQPESIIDNIEDLKIYEKYFNRRECLLQCNKKEFEHVKLSTDINESTFLNMQKRKPYEYLHICYFNMYALPKAASAAHTFLVANPTDEQMKKNLKYYSRQPEVDVNEILDLEIEDYEVLYNLGINAYVQNNYRETIASMEEVLVNYLIWENDCRTECEHQPNQEWSPELVITISNNFAAFLQCKQQCQNNLQHLHYSSGIEFLADVLNYLQISYYHVDKFNDAAKAVESYLMIMPNDEDMLENKKIYSTLTIANAFIKRDDIENYCKRDIYEKKLLDIFYQTNNFNDNTIV